jgi:hypothetical protein
MQKLVFTNGNGESVDFTDFENYCVTSWEGFDNVSQEVQSQTVPFHDGSVYIDTLLSDRELSITVAMNDRGNLQRRYELKENLISILNPKMGIGKLVYTNDCLSRQISVVTAIPVFPTKNINDKGTLKFSVSFTANDPYWEDLESKSVFVDSRTPAYPINSGDVPVNVELRFIGYGAENPKIVNSATGQFIQFNGTLEGLMKVNTNFGKKTAANEILQTNLIYGGTCRSFANSASVLISVGSVIMVSKNGLDFEILGYTLENELTDVVYADDLNLFVAVGKDIVMTSSDGINWNKITVPGLADSGLAKIAYSKPLRKFVTIQETPGTMAGIWTSSDGISWTHSDAQVSGRSIVYCEFLNKFFIVGIYGIFSSTDGTSWIAQYDYSELEDICVNEQQEVLVTVSGNNYYTSTDGITWNSGQWEFNFADVNVTYSRIWGLYIVAGDYFYERGHFIAKASPDGISWTNSFELRDIENDYRYNGNRIFYSKEFNEIMIPTVSEKSQTYTRISSFDAESWEVSQNLNFSPDVLVYDSNLNLFFSRGLKSSDGLHWVEWINEFEFYSDTKLIFSKSLNKLCVVNPGTVEISEDGVTAEKTLVNPFNNFSAILYKPNSNGGIYYLSVLVENMKAIIFFDNENNWEVCYAPEIPLYNSRAAAYSDDLNCFVAVGDYGRIAKVTYSGGTPSVQNFSNDGFNDLTDVIWCDSLQIFIAVGFNGTVAIYDGISDWIFHHTNIPINIYSIAWSNTLNRFVAVGHDMTEFGYCIIYSSDGINWTPCDQESLLEGNFNDVVWSGSLNLFIAIESGEPGAMFYSSDGINWTRIQEGLPDYYIDFKSIAWSDSLGIFLVMGKDGSGNAIAGTSSGIDGWQFTVISNMLGLENIKWSDELNKFLVVAGSKIYETIDGVNFSVFYYDPNVNFYEGDIATGGTDVLVVARDGVKIFSNDEGVNWTNISTEITESPINSMSMSDDCTKMVAVGKGPRSAGNSNILINSEGGPHDWTIPENVPQEYIDTNLISVAWAENLKTFVAVGESGAILWCSALNSWNKSTTTISSTINFENVVFCDGLGLFVAIGNDTSESNPNTIILISVDGKNWNELNSYYGFNSPSIAWSKKLNKFIILGDNNNMLSSNMSEAENVIGKLNSDSNMDFMLDTGNNMLRYISDNGIGNVQVTYRQKYLGV